MPYCFIHMSGRVRNYFWAAGTDSTMDVAGWWASSGEVGADGHGLSWSEADVEAATFAWLEARRPAVQLLPNVPVPGVPQPSRVPTPSTRAPPSGTTLSREELVPTEVSPHPDSERHRPHLKKLFFEQPPAGDAEPHTDTKRVRRRVDKRPSHRDRVQKALSG